MAEFRKDYGGGYYKKKAMKFEQLNPESLAALYAGRPSRKRVIIDSLLSQLDELRETYIEEALAKSDFKDANEIINAIKNK